ncbi:MAG: hypothetical protein IJA97_01320 [Clostridia bacterium]|nr:hypothetical protein [Clostridia bacterium]
MKKQSKKRKKIHKSLFSILTCVSIGIIVAVSIAVNICFAYKFNNQYANLFTVISGWISGIATLSIGIIAYVQSHKYQKENEKFVQEQKDLAWKNSYANVCERFLNQLKEHDDIIKKYQPHKLETIFLKNLEVECFYDYELLVDDFDSDIVHFLIFLRNSTIFNNHHKEVYDALILFYLSINEMKAYYKKIMSKELEYKKEEATVFAKDAIKKYEKFIDLIYIYVEKLNHLLFVINEENVCKLKENFSSQQEERKKWYIKVKSLAKYEKKLKKDKSEKK